MEFGKQFTPSNSPPPPGCGQTWEGTTGVTPIKLMFFFLGGKSVSLQLSLPTFVHTLEEVDYWRELTVFRTPFVHFLQ